MKRLAVSLLTIVALFLCQMPKGFAATPTEPEGCGTSLNWLLAYAHLMVKQKDSEETVFVGKKQVTVAQLHDAIVTVYKRWAASNRLDTHVKRAYVEKALIWAITERKPKDDRHESLANDDTCGPPNGYANTEDALITIIDHANAAQKKAASLKSSEHSQVAPVPIEILAQPECHGQNELDCGIKVQQSNAIPASGGATITNYEKWMPTISLVLLYLARIRDKLRAIVDNWQTNSWTTR